MAPGMYLEVCSDSLCLVVPVVVWVLSELDQRPALDHGFSSCLESFICTRLLNLALLASQAFLSAAPVWLHLTLPLSLGCHQGLCQIQKWIPREFIGNRLEK